MKEKEASEFMKKINTIIFLILLVNALLYSQKSVYIPRAFNDYPLNQWSWERSYQSENFVVFWGPLVSTNPVNDPNTNLRFNPQQICDYLEQAFNKYVNEIKFVSNVSTTNFGRYKTIVVMNDTWGEGGPSGWAFGSGYDDVISAMWVHPQATRDGWVVTHEFSHGCQYMQAIQENPYRYGFRNYEPAGFFWEGHADFMSVQVYPDRAAQDFPRWLMTRHFHYSSTRHHYWGPPRLLYVIQEIYGINMINRLWKESQRNEHPLVTFRRLSGWTQSQLNDFIYEYAKREVTYDYKTTNHGGTTVIGQVLRNEYNRLKNNEPHYLWREYVILKKLTNNRYICPDYFAPQDYGINIIPLYVINVSSPVYIKFKGHTEVNNRAGWRYGFVAVDTSGNPRYGEVHRENEKVISFTVSSSERLYLVVVGAPTVHTDYVWEPGWPKIYRFPYEVCIHNAIPEGYQSNFRQEIKNRYPGRVHSNGGGWVANTATVASTVYVSSTAVVLGSSNISGNVRIEGWVWVENATIRDNVIVKDNARIRGGTYSQNAVISENAICYNCTVSGSAILKGNMFSWGGNFSGTAVVGGDAEISSASSGVYLQTPHPNNGRTENDGKGETDPSNIDINTPITPFTDEEFACPFCSPQSVVYYTLTVNINPQGAGSVSLNPSGGVYVAGTTVTLTAQANSGWRFSSWSG
ncbi:MAG: DUF6055 domain-containing protein, partial [Sulfolobales archaeon]